MDKKELKRLRHSDLYRYTGKDASRLGIRLRMRLSNPGFKYSYQMRKCRYLYEKSGWIHKVLLWVAAMKLARVGRKYGIDIPFTCEIGAGFYIGHFGCIIMSHQVKIGRNCNISQDVTIGIKQRGKRMGCPTIGDNVYIAPGARIIGGIKVGNNVAVGANCVVVDDVPDNAVVVGVPGRVISSEGAVGIMHNTDYE
jgi:serine O-acetyltransferase